MNTRYATGNNIRETRSTMLASLSRKANFTSSLVFPRAPMLPLCERSKSFSLSDLSSSSQRLGDVSPLSWKTVFANTKMIKVICNTILWRLLPVSSQPAQKLQKFLQLFVGLKVSNLRQSPGRKKQLLSKPYYSTSSPPPFFFYLAFSLTTEPLSQEERLLYTNNYVRIAWWWQ